MLRLSKLADYGTVIMVHLVQQYPQLVSASTLSGQTHIPLPTVSKLLKLFTNSGLLTSIRGSQGGYALAHTAENISLTQIIQAIDGETGLTECSIHSGECQIEAVCRIRGNWQLINRVVSTALANISLAQLAQPVSLEAALKPAVKQEIVQ